MRFPLACGLLLIVTAAVYAPSLRAGFVFEDMRDAALMLEWPGWGPFLALSIETPWRAVTLASWYLNGAVFGIQPWSFHLGNLLLHLINVGLLLGLLWRVVPWRGALIGAAVFALHPIQVEAVAYVSGRSELVAAAGVLLALHATSVGTVAGALCGVLLACLGKETAVVAWGLVPLWAVWTRAPFPALTWSLSGLAAVPAVWAWVRFDLSPDPESAAQGLVAVWRFLAMLPLPVGLSIEHDWHLWASLAVPLLIPTVLATALALTDWARATWALGWLWTLVVFAPRLVVPLFEGPHERHVYLVLIGWCLCAGYWLESHAQRKDVPWQAAHTT